MNKRIIIIAILIILINTNIALSYTGKIKFSDNKIISNNSINKKVPTLNNTRFKNYDGKTNYLAVIIGVGGRYTNQDAIELRNTLFRYKWKLQNIKLLTDEKATKENILDTFEWLKEKEDADDIILFYFCGHGNQLEKDEEPIDENDGKDEYIEPYDYDEFANENKILDDELSLEFNKLESKNILIIFDCCHSGGMIDGTNDLKKTNRIVLTACNTTEEAFENDFMKHGVFTYFLLESFKLEQKNIVDINENEKISAEEIFNYAEPKVLNFTILPPYQEEIHPQIYDGYPTDDNNSNDLDIIDKKEKRMNRRIVEIFILKNIFFKKS